MAILWETATGQPTHSPLIPHVILRARYLFLARDPNLFLLLLSIALRSFSLALSIHFTRLPPGSFSSSPRCLIPLRNCIPGVVRLRSAPTESSRDASLSASGFNCPSMPDDDASSGRARAPFQPNVLEREVSLL
jgi:hypothetical protein